MIAENTQDDKRVTMYTNDDGTFNGEALVVFFRSESVQQAIRLLDETSFTGDPRDGLMSVKEADNSYKKVKTAYTSTGVERRKVINKTLEMER
jgi:HIV Tat-specific factor 1